MRSYANVNMHRVSVDQTVVLVGYRWAVLVAALFGALLASTPMSPPSAAGALGATVLSVGFSVALVKPSALGWPVPLLLTDLAVAGLCVALTGGAGSAFVLYMTAPLLIPALRLDGKSLALAIAVAVWLYGAALVVDGRLDAIGKAVDDIAMLILVPTLGYGSLRIAADASPDDVTVPMLDEADAALLRRLARGLTYKQIAAETLLSVDSVKVSVARLYRRLGARTRAEAIARARELGLLDSGPAESRGPRK